MNKLETGITTDVFHWNAAQLFSLCVVCWYLTDGGSWYNMSPCHLVLLLLLCLIWPAICCRTLKSILALHPDTKRCLFTIHLPYTIENKQFHCTHMHRHTSSGDFSDNRMEPSTARVHVTIWEMFYNIIIMLISARLWLFQRVIEVLKLIFTMRLFLYFHSALSI